MQLLCLHLHGATQTWVEVLGFSYGDVGIKLILNP